MALHEALLVLAVDELHELMTAEAERADEGVQGPPPFLQRIPQEPHFSVVKLDLLSGRRLNAARDALAVGDKSSCAGKALERRVTDLPLELVPEHDDLKGRLGLQRIFPIVDQSEDLIDMPLKEQLTRGPAMEPSGRLL